MRREILSLKELTEMSVLELLQTHQAIIDELRHRRVVKTNNPPIGDYTEWLVSKRLGLTIQSNSHAALDGIDAQGVRYQIKSRRSAASSVQFSAIRNLEEHGFDFVIAVAFNSDYSLRFALKISYEVVPTLARYQDHTNAHILRLTNRTAEQEGVEDITPLLS